MALIISLFSGAIIFIGYLLWREKKKYDKIIENFGLKFYDFTTKRDPNTKVIVTNDNKAVYVWLADPRYSYKILVKSFYYFNDKEYAHLCADELAEKLEITND